MNDKFVKRTFCSKLREHFVYFTHPQTKLWIQLQHFFQNFPYLREFFKKRSIQV